MRSAQPVSSFDLDADNHSARLFKQFRLPVMSGGYVDIAWEDQNGGKGFIVRPCHPLLHAPLPQINNRPPFRAAGVRSSRFQAIYGLLGSKPVGGPTSTSSDWKMIKAQSLLSSVEPLCVSSEVNTKSGSF